MPKTVGGMVNQFMDHGYGWVAVQYGRNRGTDWAVIRQRGGLWGIWDSDPSMDRVDEALSYHPDFYIAQAETDAQAAGAITAMMMAQHQQVCPYAFVTDLGPSRRLPGFDAAMQHAGAACLVECYQNDNPQATPANMVWDAKRRGYEYVVPVLGVYHGYPLADYNPSSLPGFAVWLAETLTDEDWLQ